MKTQKVTFQVEDMHCSSCPKLIKMTLSEISGVIDVTASLDTKQVVIDYDENLVKPEAFVKAIGEIGYTAKSI